MHAARRISVVDDDAAIRDILMLAFGDEGYEAACWTGDTEPLAFLRASHPALIMLDLRLSGHDQGITLVESVRADACLASVPLVVCSADAPSLRENKARLDELAVAVVCKPFDLDALIDTIKCMVR